MGMQVHHLIHAYLQASGYGKNLEGTFFRPVKVTPPASCTNPYTRSR